VFGRSFTAPALLAGFAAVLNRLRADGHPQRVVVQRHAYSYDHPATTDAAARASIDPDRWSHLVLALSRRNIGRITVDVTVKDSAGRQVGRLAGVFAALPDEPLSGDKSA